MIGCWCDSGFLAKIDRARRSLTRSQFCREALAAKLRSLGIEVSDAEIASPDRVGKGGRPRTQYRIQSQNAHLNESGDRAKSRKTGRKKK